MRLGNTRALGMLKPLEEEHRRIRWQRLAIERRGDSGQRWQGSQV
ncbi:hypothetical protein [Parafrigoribacterium humi]